MTIERPTYQDDARKGHPSSALQQRCGARKGTIRAFSLAEVLVSMLLVSGLIVVALNTVGDATVGRQKTGDRGVGQLLAQDLMSEILAQAYEEPVDTPVFGPETAEGAGTRVSYDDVDDYSGWSASPPQKKDGAETPGQIGWRRTVTVEYVYPDDLNTSTGTSDVGVKKITVTVEHNDIPVASLVAIRTAAADMSAP
ncbi:MAG: hypothetical protein WBE26_01610 [Phycisphaerae bacterium]